MPHQTLLNRRQAFVAACIAASTALGGCSAQTPRVMDKGAGAAPRLLGGHSLLVVDVSKAPIDCRSQKVCDQPILATKFPTLPALDCGLSVAEITVARRTNGPDELTWSLPQASADITYRFQMDQVNGEPIGIFVFGADNGDFKRDIADGGKRFVLKWVNKPNLSKIYKYGVFLEFQLPNQTTWTKCAALDPIIVSVE